MNIPLKNFTIMGRIFLFTSSCLFAGMIYFLSNTFSFIDSSAEAEGTITGYTQKVETGSEGKTTTNYYPVIEYRDARGNSYSFNSDTVMNYEVFVFIKAKESEFKNPLYNVPAVKVRYNKLNPSEARPARSFWDLWGTTIAYGIIALVFSILGTTFLLIQETPSIKTLKVP